MNPHISPLEALISVGIALFGMTPFGWRFSGALFGTLMLPVLYLLLKRLLAALPPRVTGQCSLRLILCTIPNPGLPPSTPTPSFFLLLMYYFVAVFVDTDLRTASMRRICLPLLLCGISFGFGAAANGAPFTAARDWRLCSFGIWPGRYGCSLPKTGPRSTVGTGQSFSGAACSFWQFRLGSILPPIFPFSR